MLTWARRKHTDETRDYYFDWGDAFVPICMGDADPVETIASIAATIVSGTIVIVSQQRLGAMLQMVVSGGAVGEVAIVESTLTTSKGRILTERSRLRIGSF